MRIFAQKKFNLMQMKHYPIPVLVAVLCLLTSCAEDIDKAASRYLDAAASALSDGQFAEAKRCIDSIKVVYPKAFETRKAGIALMRRVEMAEATQTLAYTDSLLALCRACIDEMVPQFLYEKDARYEEVGRFLGPSQRLEDNIGRNYLRASVDETGRMTLASLYRGTSYINHNAIRVSAAGTWAETPMAATPYQSSDATAKTERCDFVLGDDGGVIAFIALHAGESVKVEYLGGTSYSTTLTRSDTRAIANVYALAQQLQEAARLSAIADEASRKISFLENKEANADDC